MNHIIVILRPGDLPIFLGPYPSYEIAEYNAESAIHNYDPDLDGNDYYVAALEEGTLGDG